MSRLVRMTAIAALLAGSALAAPQASAHGWHRQHHGWHRHHRVYYRATAPHFGWGHHCHVRRFVTYYGALAYRQVCH